MMDSPFNTTEAAIMAENAHSFFSTVLEKMEHFPIKISFIFGLSIILGSVVPYIPQYLTIQQSQNTEGFSLYVCLTLLVANILRIIFWFGNQYETPLLIQSIVMIAAMFALLELCVRVRNNNLILSRRKNYFTGQENGAVSGRSSALDMNVDEEKVQVKFSDSSKNTSVIIPGGAVSAAGQTVLAGSNNHEQSSNNDISPETILNVPSLSTAAATTQLDSLSSATAGKNYSTIPPAAEMEPLPVHTFKNDTDESNDCYRTAPGDAPEDGPKSDVALLGQELNNNSNHHNGGDHTKLSINVNQDDLVEIDVAIQDNNNATQLKAKGIPDDWPDKRHFMDFDWRYFWEWTDFISYFECMVAFTFIAGSIMFMFGHYKYVVESFGFAALVTESLLASPQFFRNFKSKSTEGMSRIMVVTWFIGDLYKTIYFIMRDTPVQFWLCGFIQITFDLLIFMQLFIYRKSNYKKLSKTAKSGATNQVQDRDQMLGTGTTVHQRQGINTGKADVILADNLTGPVNSGKEDSIKMHKIHRTTAVAGKEERNLLGHNETGTGSRKNSKLSQSQSQSPILDDGSVEEDNVEMNPVVGDKNTSSNAFVNSDFDIVTEFRMQSDSSDD